MAINIWIAGTARVSSREYLITAYLLRRLLLMIPTLVGIMTISFFIFEFVPGGPLDQIRAMLEGRSLDGGEVAASGGTGAQARKLRDPKLEMRLIRQFGYNQSRLTRYLRTLLWYGQDSVISSREIEDHSAEKFHYGSYGGLIIREGNTYVAFHNHFEGEKGGGELVYLPGEKALASVVGGEKFSADTGINRNGGGDLTPIPLETLARDGYEEIFVRQEFLDAVTRWENWHGVFLLKFGDSIHHNKDVTELVWARLPVSMSLGIFSFFSTYIVCVFLGIAKAVHNGERFDTLTSVVILFGYSIPGFVLAVLLIVYFGPGDQHLFNLIPLDGGLTSSTVEGYADWSAWEKIIDYLHHLVAPVLCMSVGSFAVLTILTKNSILEEIHKLYAVAARARGLSEKRVLYKHVLRNSLIPLVTGFPSSFLAMFFTGSLLIEKIFNLNGMGLLSYNAVLERDFPLMIGSLFIFTLINLAGILLTDLAFVVVDPRINFDKASS